MVGKTSYPTLAVSITKNLHKMTTPNKLHRLNVTFLSVLKSKSGRVISRRETDSSYFFEGKTKKECINKAKRDSRYSSSYAKNWELVEAD